MLDPGLERFSEEVARGAEMDLARAALTLGLYARPDLDVEAYLARLEQLAEEARGWRLEPLETLSALFGEQGFRGNSEDYYDPRNSLLHEVLDRRLGIPITLSVLAMEIGRRVRIPVAGVPFPGHFLVRVGQGETSVIVDPYNGGVTVGDEGLLLLMRATTGRIGALGPSELGNASPEQILGRMMQNLKVIYLRGQDYVSGLAIQERFVVLRPDSPEERRDRGLLGARLGRNRQAEVDLRDYLKAMPEAGDAEAVRRVLEQVAEGVAHGHGEPRG